tara:strand:- start:1422 stop:1718 length:297 start_codon:yes stop_codon:yes gene_type:complete
MMYRPLPESVTIKRSKIDGLGLFATQHIKSGTSLGVARVRDERFENGYIRTPLGGLYNHSDSPNCEVVDIDGFPCLVTICEIEPGDELVVEYTLYKIS